MKLAIISDIHDNVWALAAALQHCQEASALLCCGDLCSPFIIPLLAEGFPERPIHIVFGNNDADLFRITRNAARFPNIHLHGAYFQGELGGLHVAANHYDDIAYSIAAAGLHDLVCCGHNHTYQIADVSGFPLLNPGALLGYDPIHRRDVPSTFILYDTTSRLPQGYQVSPTSSNLRTAWDCLPYP